MKTVILCLCALTGLIACTPTNPGGGGGAATNPPTTAPGGAVVPIAGSLANSPVFGPIGSVCIGELQNQTLGGTSNTVFDFVRADHANITVARGTYTTSFQAASGCDSDGDPITFGPVLGPTTINFTVNYVGAFVREEDPVCIAGSFVLFPTFTTAGGPLLDGAVEAMARQRIHEHLDLQLALVAQALVGNSDSEIEEARCDDWEPLVPAEFGF